MCLGIISDPSPLCAIAIALAEVVVVPPVPCCQVSLCCVSCSMSTVTSKEKRRGDPISLLSRRREDRREGA